jgi:hypothetical protein
MFYGVDGWMGRVKTNSSGCKTDTVERVKPEGGKTRESMAESERESETAVCEARNRIQHGGILSSVVMVCVFGVVQHGVFSVEAKVGHPNKTHSK